MKTLDELFIIARQYGRVIIYTANDGRISADIMFSTVPGISLEAKSGFDHQTPQSALEAAIRKAEQIMEQFEKPQERIKLK